MKRFKNRWSRRELLAAAGLGAVWCAAPLGAATSLWPRREVQDGLLEIGLPGAEQMLKPIQAALDGGRRLAWDGDTATLPVDGAGRLARIRLRPVRAAEDGVKIEVDGPGGYLLLERRTSDGKVLRVSAQPAGDSGVAPTSVRGFDTICSSDEDVELTFSCDLALRYRSPQRIAGARLPESYKEFAGAIVSQRR